MNGSSSCGSPSIVKRVSSMDAASSDWLLTSSRTGCSLPPEFILLPHATGPPRLMARTHVPSHRKFGPYQAKIRKDPSPSSFNLKVSLIFFPSGPDGLQHLADKTVNTEA